MIIKLPDNWNEVTVEQFAKIKGLTISDHLIEIVSILSDQTIETVETFAPEAWPKIIDKIGWVFKVPEEEKLNKIIKIEEKEYFLINLSDLSYRQWANLILLIRDQKNNLHRIFAMLYNGEEEVFLKASIGDLYGAMVFFYHLENEYLLNMQNYLISQMKMKTRREKTLQRMERLRCRITKSLTFWRKESLQT